VGEGWEDANRVWGPDMPLILLVGARGFELLTLLLELQKNDAKYLYISVFKITSNPGPRRQEATFGEL
jgi:hypothetical protein